MSSENRVWGYLTAYIKSMRLYFAFITGISGWVGVSYYQYLMPEQSDLLRSILVLCLLFLSYGINQVVNDYLGLPEDQINAPHRPMVTGELPAQPALIVSLGLMALVSLISFLFNPWSAIPVVAGVLLNILYNTAKAWSLIGNLVFGLSIVMCTLYGFLASGPTPDFSSVSGSVVGLIMVVLLNGVMTYYTYFKDYEGDKAAGQKTFVVRYGLRTASIAGLVGAWMPMLCLLVFALFGLANLEELLENTPFVFCAAVTQFLLCWTAWRFYRNPVGEETYLNLSMNIRACVAGQIAIIAIYNSTLALYLLAASYILIGVLFELHKDARA